MGWGWGGKESRKSTREEVWCLCSSVAGKPPASLAILTRTTTICTETCSGRRIGARKWVARDTSRCRMATRFFPWIAGQGKGEGGRVISSYRGTPSPSPGDNRDTASKRPPRETMGKKPQATEKRRELMSILCAFSSIFFVVFFFFPEVTCVTTLKSLMLLKGSNSGVMRSNGQESKISTREGGKSRRTGHPGHSAITVMCIITSSI